MIGEYESGDIFIGIYGVGAPAIVGSAVVGQSRIGSDDMFTAEFDPDEGYTGAFD